MRAKEFIFEDKADLIDAIRDFLPLAIKHLKLKSLPKIIIEKDVESKHDQPTFGKYENKHEVISLDIEERHPMDVIRTLAHELVHYQQDKEGRLTDKSWKTGSPDENEAHEKAGEMMREFDKQHPTYMHLKAIQFNENFADGKNPGRKGLAKRSGVNTKASVSSLRKTAKHSTGEKARMAHWLANMKAGRAKHEDLADEGWKDWVAGAAIGAAALGGSGDAEAAKKKPTEKPSIVQQVSKQDIAKTVTGNPHEVVLKKAAQKAGIQGNELAAFLSQCAHETMDFKHMKEIGGSLDFKKYDIRFAPNKAKSLGNTQPGDGAKYKGRGYIQLTGKYNYKKAGDALGLPLAEKPQLVEKPEVAAKVAVWFWKNRVKPNVDNFQDTKAVTKGINPGLKHLDQRSDKFKSFQVAMK